MAEVTMPRLSDTMSEGAVGRWLKKPGDPIKDGDVIAEIETDKATMELMAFESGTLQKILVPEGKTVPIGEPIAIIGSGAAQADTEEKAPDIAVPEAGHEQSPGEEGGQETLGHNTAEAKAQVQQPVSDVEPAVPPEATKEHSENGRIKASPLARRVAAEQKVDLAQLTGSGPGGRIIKEDVERFVVRPAAEAQAAAKAEPTVPQPAPAPSGTTQPAPAGPRQPLTRIRQTIARRMVESKGPVPHFYVSMAVQMDNALALRSQINAFTEKSEGVKISINDLVVKAAALTLRKFPRFNSSFAGDALELHDQINVGVAVALDEGLMTMVVADTDKKPISQVAREVKELAERARTGKLRPEDLRSKATFTTSNLGMYGVDEFTAIITPPEVAILAVGGAAPTPMVENGQVVIKTLMKVTLSTDHRVANGAEAAQFLVELKRLLEQPMALLV